MAAVIAALLVIILGWALIRSSSASLTLDRSSGPVSLAEPACRFLSAALAPLRVNSFNYVTEAVVTASPKMIPK